MISYRNWVDFCQFSGRRADAVDYFNSIDHPIPSEYFNPADHLLDLVSVDPRKSNEPRSLERVNKITSTWRMRTTKSEYGYEAAKESTTPLKRGEGTTSMIVALPVSLERHWKNLWRQKEVRILESRSFRGMLKGSVDLV